MKNVLQAKQTDVYSLKEDARGSYFNFLNVTRVLMKSSE